jgi:arabinose-5-phosphate isomerase
LGDALAVALLQRRGFKEEDFAQFHPGGTLGRRLLVKVRDLMHVGEHIPRVRQDVSATEAILEMTAKKLGMTAVVAASGALIGVITDGDLRRFAEKGGDFRGALAADVMTRNPKTIGPDELAARALDMMERFSITSLVATESSGTIAGVIHLHDLLRNGIV